VLGLDAQQPQFGLAATLGHEFARAYALRHCAGLGPSTAGGSSLSGLRHEILRRSVRFRVCFSTKSARVCHEIEEALKILLACCNAA